MATVSYHDPDLDTVAVSQREPELPLRGVDTTAVRVHRTKCGKAARVLAARPRFPVRVRCAKCGGLAWADADQVADGVALVKCCGERMVEVRDATEG